MSDYPEAAPLPPKPFRRPTTYLALGLFLFFFLAAGSFSLWFAFCMEQTMSAPRLSIGMAALFLFLPARLVVLSTRRKLTKGCWLPTEEELAITRAKSLGRAQSPKGLRLSKAFYLSFGICAIIAYVFADRVLIHRHGFKSWQMLENICLQILVLGAWWGAYRSTRSKSDSPAQY